LLIEWVFIGAFYGFVSLILYLTYVRGLESRRQCYAVLAALVLAQFGVRIFSRTVLPGYVERSGDEAFWVQEMARFQLQGTFSAHAGVEGPGVYYLVPLVHSVFHVSFADSLIGIGTFVGILSVLSVFLFYSQGGEYREALVAAVLVSFADAVVYSTTVVRPLLFTLTLVPIALYAADAGRLTSGFRLLAYFALAFLTLIFHAPIGFVVLLAVLSLFFVLKPRRDWVDYAVLWGSYLAYALALVTIFSGLAALWAGFVIGQYPLLPVRQMLGGSIILIFVLIPATLTLISLGGARIRASTVRFAGANAPRILLLGSAILIAALSIGLLARYGGYLITTYGNYSSIILLHSWKIAFVILGMIGLWACWSKDPKPPALMATCWLLSMGAITVGLQLASSSVLSIPDLWNIDERFLEFAYYPAFYFIAYGIRHVTSKLPFRMKLVFLLALSLYVIPSLILGTRDLSLIQIP